MAIVASALLLSTALGAGAVGDSRQTVPAEEIAAKLQAGEPVDYRNVTISGYLDLSRLEKPVSQPMRIADSELLGAANLDQAVFSEAVDLKGTVFLGNLSLGKTKFLSDADFSLAQFAGESDWRGAEFSGPALFIRSSFREDASFANAIFGRDAAFGYASFGNISFANSRFDGDATFLGANFSGHAEFGSVQFARLASFWEAEFGKASNFFNAVFQGPANFLGADFRENASLTAARFGADVTFRNSTFRKNAAFGLANFAGFADFAGTSFQGVAFFGVTKFSDHAYFPETMFEKDLILEGARIYSMQLDNAQFSPKTRINLKDADFSRFVARWKTIEPHMEFNGAAYLAMTKNYKNLEWFDDADQCYYQYRRISQELEPWGWGKIADIIAWLSCGYGVRVSYTVFWCLFTIFLFGLVFWAGNGMRKFEIEGMELPVNPASRPAQRVSLIDALYFSTAMFTTSQAPVNTYPVKFYRHLAMLEGILGWFFLGLFVVVLSGVLIR
jgi:hypothetical protein